MNKISLNGGDNHELYEFLTQKDKNGLVSSEVGQNFQKYLINENWEVVKVGNNKRSPRMNLSPNG